MRIHKAGRRIVFVISFFISLLNGLLYIYEFSNLSRSLSAILSVFFILVVTYFYRNPQRYFCDNILNGILASADGKIVAIEEVYETEYFKDKRILVAIFMTPLNVHINWYPFTGKILMVKL